MFFRAIGCLSLALFSIATFAGNQKIADLPTRSEHPYEYHRLDWLDAYQFPFSFNSKANNGPAGIVQSVLKKARERNELPPGFSLHALKKIRLHSLDIVIQDITWASFSQRILKFPFIVTLDFHSGLFKDVLNLKGFIYLEGSRDERMAVRITNFHKQRDGTVAGYLDSLSEYHLSRQQTLVLTKTLAEPVLHTILQSSRKARSPLLQLAQKNGTLAPSLAGRFPSGK